jgi:uncharacterized protein DUF6519/parallel beta helix pectate lyase-like protein
MKGDFTRFSHQPRRGYAGVLMQQGRVTLDADWNEQRDIDDHRWRLQTIDTIGRACAPAGAAGFALTLAPGGTDIIISPGRIYIDGLLVELIEQTAVAGELVDDTTVVVRDIAPDGELLAAGHWVEADSVDTTSGATMRTVAKVVEVDTDALHVTLDADLSAHAAHDDLRIRRLTTFLTQPFFPAGHPTFGDPFTPQDWGGQTHIAYLDVWRRHVTAVEDPYLREVALGGPDTATRVQTVWALRILRDADGVPADVAGLRCHDDHPAWDAVVAGSGGRMSARAEAAPDPEDPCAIAPEAGYRGLENRLYRVEVHSPGPLGTATFKWSRDNGSVLAAITAFEAADEVRVHSLGRDRVLRFHADDRVEVFSAESELGGVAGTMASVVGEPDEAERTFTVDTDVSAYDGRIPRVRRWDHGGAEPATTEAWLELEYGVQVRFGGGPFHVGDHWVVPARVATGDVAGFSDAPPRGVEHHLARMALLTWPTAQDPARIDDCRSTFPSLCEPESGCCTLTVGEGGDHASLQDAVDAAAGIDGPVRICVLPGEHVLPLTVVVRRGNLVISGCGRQSHVVSLRGGVLLFLDVDNVRVEDLRLTSSSAWPTVGALDVTGLEVIDCQVANVRSEPGVPPPEPPGEPPAPPPGGLFTPPDVSTEPVSTEARPSTPSTPQLPVGPAVFAARSDGLLVGRCVLVGAPAVSFDGEFAWIQHNVARGGGVWIREGSARVAVRANTIGGGLGPGVLLGGLLPGEQSQSRIDGVREVTIADNHIEAMAREGITTPAQTQDPTGEVEDIVVSGNTIRGCGWVPLTQALSLGGGVLLRDATQVQFIDNTIADNGPRDAADTPLKIGFGVLTLTCQAIEIRGNTITDNGVQGALDDGAPRALNGGVVAIGAVGSGSTAVDSLVLRTPAVAVRDNTIVTPEGAGVILHGVGPMAVTGNSIASTYLGLHQVSFGRAVAVLDLGAAPDLGVFLLAAGGQGTVRNFHGQVQITANQISVQADARGLPERDPDTLPQRMPPSELITGSAVFTASLDDVLIGDTQVVNEILPRRDSILRLESTVATFAMTTRMTGNRITELPATAMLSYVGTAFAHVVTDNVTTHCIRAEGIRVKKHDNIELLCPSVEQETRFRVIVGR